MRKITTLSDAACVLFILLWITTKKQIINYKPSVSNHDSCAFVSIIFTFLCLTRLHFIILVILVSLSDNNYWIELEKIHALKSKKYKRNLHVKYRCAIRMMSVIIDIIHFTIPLIINLIPTIIIIILNARQRSSVPTGQKH